MAEDQRKALPEETLAEMAETLEDSGVAAPIQKVSSSWRTKFSSLILSRGQKYYEEGCVSQITQCGNRITAHVIGTEDYCVKVDLPGGVLEEGHCTCPYDARNNCKHKAAVMFAVEAGNYTFTEEDSDAEEDSLSLPWCDAIEKLSADILRECLLDYADYNEEIKEYLSIWYLHGLPEGLMEQWKENLQAYANAKSEGHRYVPEDEVYYFMTGVRSTLSRRLRLLRKVGATMDAFYWLGIVFEIASKKVGADEEGEFEDFYYDCVEDWNILFDEATDEQREQMQAWFWKHRAAFFAHIIYADQLCFLYLPWSEKLERKNLEILDKLLADCNNHEERILLMDCRVEIMDFLDYAQEEVRDYWKEHLVHDYARYRLLEDYDDEEDNGEIILLLKQLKEMDEDDLPRLIQDSVWLTMMYRKENAKEAYEAERALLFTQYRQALQKDIPMILNTKSAKQFIACLDSLRSAKDNEVDQMIEELVDALCSNPATARKGIVEMVNRAGYEWPKSFHTPV